MKVKVLSRSEREWNGVLDGYGSKDSGPLRRQYNPDPVLHPFEKAKEEKRALNAAKLEKVFAQPFIGALEAHGDSPIALKRSKVSTANALSCSVDGSIIVWNLMLRTPRWTREDAHSAVATDCVFTIDDSRILSCSSDKTVKLWAPNLENSKDESYTLDDYDFRSRIPGASVSTGRDTNRKSNLPLAEFHSKLPLKSVDAHWTQQNRFVTSNDVVEVWDTERSHPIHKLSWGASGVGKVRFNPIETDLIVSTGADRSVAIYDLRMQTAVRKLVLYMRSNAVSWNPIEAFNFTLANEDHNLYTYDIRNLSSSKAIHEGHVRPVLAVDYAPTGQEIVSGSYDHTLRLYDLRNGQFGRKARDVYHSKRMQRVFDVSYSIDSQIILSASDDGDIRMWKSKADRPMKPLLPKERDALNYAEKLKQRYKHVPEVRRILNHKHLPKPIHRMQAAKRIMKDSARRKTANRRAHSTPGSEPHVPDNKKNIVKELE